MTFSPQGIPSAPPLFGCSNGHLMCNSCRSADGEGLGAFFNAEPPGPNLPYATKGFSCPDCGEKDLKCRLAVAESLLPTELQGGPRPCPYKVMLLLSATFDINNPYTGIWLHCTSWCWIKVSPCTDLPLPTCPLSKSYFLLLLPLQGPLLHYTGALLF